METHHDTTTNNEPQDDDEMYRCLVVDSGPIIRMTGLTSLRNKAKLYYTVPAVFQEVRDAKARQHLESLPFDLITREPSAEGIQAMVNFARQTGDYQSLSSVDLQILGLLYDLGTSSLANLFFVLFFSGSSQSCSIKLTTTAILFHRERRMQWRYESCPYDTQANGGCR